MGMMGVLSSLLGVVGFCVGLLFGLIIGFLLFVYSKHKDVKEPEIISLHEYETSALQKLLPEIPCWIKSPDYERVDWLNKFISDVWPFLDKAICAEIRSTAKPIFEEYIGQYHIEDIKFENLSLGTLPPTFHGMKVYETNENELILEPTIKWAGNPNMVLVVKVMCIDITIQLVDLQVFVNPRIHLKPLVPTFPCFSNILVSLMEKPHVDFGLNVLGGDVMSIPGLYGFVQETIRKQVAILYHWPQYLEVPVLDISTSVKKPVGVLHVNIVRAIKLMKADFLGASDPYVKLKLSGDKRVKRTSIKKKTLYPEWNESFRITVKDPETQTLELHVFDWDKVGGHDDLGVQQVPLKLLIPNETKEFTLNLAKDIASINKDKLQDKKSRGQLVLELTFSPFRLDTTESFKGELERKQSSLKGSELDDNDDEEPFIGSGVLIVTIIEALNIEGEHHTNPQALIILRGEKRKTQKIKKNRNPRWNEDFEFIFEEAPVKEKLYIEILSKHKTISLRRKESLGFIEIPLADVVHNGRINDKYHLINSKNGIIQIQIEWQST